jgi:hypothetical protein
MHRSSWLVLLVGVNLVLLAVLVLSLYHPPAAYGQAMGFSGNYILVSGQVDQGHDAVYLFDLQHRMLHVFQSTRGRPVAIRHADSRDLTRDFRGR